ncbi:MAG: hypothetical protein J6Y30_13390 [Treponema sp.]|nr:hypothetical protein [Treponema sp.]
MDRKRHKIIYYALIFLLLMILFIFNFLTGGNLLPWNRKEFERPLLKSISIDSSDVVTIVLDNANKRKPIGKIYDLDLFYLVPVFEYEENENEIIVKEDISEYKEKFTEDRQYDIGIKWYGGHLYLETIYKEGQFTVLDEHYTDKI